MALLRRLVAWSPALSRRAVSRGFCRRIDGRKPDGGLKDFLARVTVLAMHRDGIIVLSPQQRKWFGPETGPPLVPSPATLDEIRPRHICLVVGGTWQGRPWNEFVARHHYLGNTTLVRAEMRYMVHDRNGLALAMLGYSTAAWTLEARDRYMGWSPEMRRKNLLLVIDNPGFLILPWVRIPNLGSHILALVRRRLPGDWRRALQHHYGPGRDVCRNLSLSLAASAGPPVGSMSERQGWRARRYRQRVRQARQGYLALPVHQALETHSQRRSVSPSRDSKDNVRHESAERVPRGWAEPGSAVKLWAELGPVDFNRTVRDTGASSGSATRSLDPGPLWSSPVLESTSVSWSTSIRPGATRWWLSGRRWSATTTPRDLGGVASRWPDAATLVRCRGACLPHGHRG